MDIHRFEAAWFAVGLLLIVGFIATIVYGSVGAGVAMIDDSGGTVDPGAVSSGGEASPWDDPGVEKVGEDHYVAYVRAQQFAFVPGSSEPIRIPADALVTFRVTSPDVTHGFSIVGTNVNTMVIPGQVSEMDVRFDEPGTYGLVCHEYCGGGHHAMGGTVEVVPQDEYEANQAGGSASASLANDGQSSQDQSSQGQSNQATAAAGGEA